MNFWEMNRFQAGNDLVAGAAEVGHRMRENRAIRKQEEAFQAEYAAALARAKLTGVMPNHLQTTLPIDYYGLQYGIKVVILRELAKLNPEHSLVKSSACREMIGLLTLQKFNLDNRPTENVNFDKYIVDDKAATAVFQNPELYKCLERK